MKKYKVLRPIALQGRVEIGQIIELSDEDAKAFSEGTIEEVKENAADANTGVSSDAKAADASQGAPEGEAAKA